MPVASACATDLILCSPLFLRFSSYGIYIIREQTRHLQLTRDQVSRCTPDGSNGSLRILLSNSQIWRLGQPRHRTCCLVSLDIPSTYEFRSSLLNSRSLTVRISGTYPPDSLFNYCWLNGDLPGSVDRHGEPISFQ